MSCIFIVQHESPAAALFAPSSYLLAAKNFFVVPHILKKLNSTNTAAIMTKLMAAEVARP